MGPVNFIEIDLQPDRILKQLKGGGPEVAAAFFQSLKKIHTFTNLVQLNQDHGLRWEKLEGKVFPGTRMPVYSFRITGDWRALCSLHSGPVIEVVAVSDHDGAY